MRRGQSLHPSRGNLTVFMQALRQIGSRAAEARGRPSWPLVNWGPAAEPRMPCMYKEGAMTMDGRRASDELQLGRYDATFAEGRQTSRSQISVTPSPEFLDKRVECETRYHQG